MPSKQLTSKATALPKDYQVIEPNLLAELIKIFNRPALQTVKGDVFGRIYEYFLNQFAQSAAQEGGEFLTMSSSSCASKCHLGSFQISVTSLAA
ncbi:N-6 DNA methylase [Shewanella khirikhana]|uniref:N-6 DNA methylase n=1 Tax=Shewanella khirikhana TaxID=1965282 RepID=UPI0030CE7B91